MTISFSKALASISVVLLATALQAQTTDANQTSTGNSKVRIVRLSEVKGVVQLDRNTGRGFESAMANLPIVEQSQLRTGEGVAEVEFEDNSTLRLAPDSQVEFPSLERLATGKTASSVHLRRGTAYISLLKTPGNQFTLIVGQRQLDLQPATHIRVQMDGSKAKLAVLDGTVRIDGPEGAVDVSKKKTATIEILDQSQPLVARNVAPTPFDSWDQNAAQYHSRAAALNAMNSPYAYGSGDMAYYGSFFNSASCGAMWRPYFASAAWDPFSNGAWAWYPGAGYSWVSPYPWGWTPYHSGSWAYCDGTGWGWMPSGGWNGINNVAVIPSTGGSRHIVLPPHSPIHPPRPGEPTLRPINLKPLVSSDISSGSSFLFRKDSAGLGVPRGALGRLDKLSRQADRRGVASTPIYVTAPLAPSGRVTSSQAMGASTSIHRGIAPSPSMGQQNGSFGGARGGSSGGAGGTGGGWTGGGAGRSMAPSAPSAPASSGGRK